MKLSYGCLVTLVVMVAIGAGPRALAQRCAPPTSLFPLAPTAVDFQNVKATVDYHLFVLSWSPMFCATYSKDQDTRAKCLAGAADFVAAGLIPRSREARREEDHPRHCIPSMPLSLALIRRHYCLTPNPQFMQDEWVRFGGCSFANAGEFFDRITQLWDSVKKPDLAPQATRNGILTAGQIRQSFVASNRSLGIRPRNVIISSEARRFSGVAICYDRQFLLTNCPDEGTGDHVRLQLTVIRN